MSSIASDDLAERERWAIARPGSYFGRFQFLGWDRHGNSIWLDDPNLAEWFFDSQYVRRELGRLLDPEALAISSLALQNLSRARE